AAGTLPGPPWSGVRAAHRGRRQRAPVRAPDAAALVRRLLTGSHGRTGFPSPNRFRRRAGFVTEPRPVATDPSGHRLRTSQGELVRVDGGAMRNPAYGSPPLDEASINRHDGQVAQRPVQRRRTERPSADHREDALVRMLYDQHAAPLLSFVL